MNDNLFFKPTPLYKEFLVLDLIEKKPKITQRELSNEIGSSVSMINTYLEEYESKGYLKRIYITNKNLEYHITKKGIERKKVLNMSYLKSSHTIYTYAKENILSFLKQIIYKGFRKIFLYGAGEVAEIMLNVVNEDKNIPLEILGIVDDNISKQEKYIMQIPIVNLNKINNIEHDGLLISSYTHNDAIYRKLLNKNYKVEKIITFFDI